MGKGILGGAVLGVIVALFGAGILSLLAPPPNRATLPEPKVTSAAPEPETTPAPAPVEPETIAEPAPLPDTSTPTEPEPEVEVVDAPEPETVAPETTEAPAVSSEPPTVETVEMPTAKEPQEEVAEAAPLPEEHARIVVVPEASPPAPPAAPADPEMAETAPAALPQPVLLPEAPQGPAQPEEEIVVAGLPPAPELPNGQRPDGVERPSSETLPVVPPTATPLPVPAPSVPAVPTAPTLVTPDATELQPLPAPATAAPLPRIARPETETSPIAGGADLTPAVPTVPEAPEVEAAPVTQPQPAPEPAEPAPLPRVVRPGNEPTPETEDPPAAEPAAPPQVVTTERATGALRVAVPGRKIAAPKVRVNRLPSIGGEAPAPAAPNGAAPEAPVDDGTALARNAVSFDPVAGRPLFSIILMDDPSARITEDSLNALAFPVTFVVDAAQSDASIVARTYRDAGHEVVMMVGGLPPRATAQDVEVSLSTYLKRVPNAVAIMDPALSGVQTNRAMLRQMVAIAGDSGHGLVSLERGLNAAQQVATSEGVPNALVFRVLDDKGETASTMQRYLDRAAFRADQQGQVAVLGHSRPETISTLINWAVAGKGGEVNLAPISALMRRP